MFLPDRAQIGTHNGKMNIFQIFDGFEFHHYSVLYKQVETMFAYLDTITIKRESISLPERIGAKAREGATTLCKCPFYQKAIAGIALVVLIVGIHMVVHFLIEPSSVSLAEEIAMEDPGLRVVLAEEGFLDLNDLDRMVAKSGEESIHQVILVDPLNHHPVAVATVDMSMDTVTAISLTQTTQEYDQIIHPTGERGSSAMETVEYALELARSDPRVSDLLDDGARVFGQSHLIHSQGETVIMKLQLRKSEWFLGVALPGGEILGLYEDSKGSLTVVSE